MTLHTIGLIRQILTFRPKDYKFPVNLAMMALLADLFRGHGQRLARMVQRRDIFMAARTGNGISSRKIHCFIYDLLARSIDFFPQMALAAIAQLDLLNQRQLLLFLLAQRGFCLQGLIKLLILGSEIFESIMQPLVQHQADLGQFLAGQ